MTTGTTLGVEEIRMRALASYQRRLQESGGVYHAPSDVDVQFINEEQTKGTVNLRNSVHQLWFAEFRVTDQGISFTPLKGGLLAGYMDRVNTLAVEAFIAWFHKFQERNVDPGLVTIHTNEDGLTGRVEITVHGAEEESWSVAYRINLKRDKIQISDPQHHQATASAS